MATFDVKAELGEAARAEIQQLRAQIANERAAHAVACQMRDEAEAKVERLRAAHQRIVDNKDNKNWRKPELVAESMRALEQTEPH